MKTSADVLAAVREKLGGVSAYRVAQEWGVSRQFISAVANGREKLSGAQCDKAAEILEIEPAIVRMIVEAEGAKMSHVRESYYRVLKRAGVAVMMLCGAGLPSPGVQAMQAHDALTGIYIMRSYIGAREAGASGSPVAVIDNNRCLHVSTSRTLQPRAWFTPGRRCARTLESCRLQRGLNRT